MAVKYQTGVSTLTQFITITVLNLINMVASSIHSCVKGGGECLGDTTINMLYFLVLAVWFGFLWVLGYAAQDRHSKRIAQILIAAELVVLGAALLDSKHYPNVLGLIISLSDASFAVWTIVLAWRLVRANGGRITTARPRRRVSN